MIEFQARLPGENVAKLCRILLVAVLRPDGLVQLPVVGLAVHAPSPRCEHRQTPEMKIESFKFISTKNGHCRCLKVDAGKITILEGDFLLALA